MLTKTKNSIIEERAGKLIHITCKVCQPHNGNLYMSYCGEWKPLTGKYNKNNTHCPLCEYIDSYFQHTVDCK